MQVKPLIAVFLITIDTGEKKTRTVHESSVVSRLKH